MDEKDKADLLDKLRSSFYFYVYHSCVETKRMGKA